MSGKDSQRRMASRQPLYGPLCGLPLVAQAQLAAYRLALLKGRDPDEPPRLRKITTTW